jgi:trehalose/maltose hydrolase-like predicted phosphorylase
MMGMKYSFKAEKDCLMVIETGIDGDVWDINGPHLKEFTSEVWENCIVLKAFTDELKIPVVISESADISFGNCEIVNNNKSIVRRIYLEAKAGQSYSFTKFVSVFTGRDNVPDPSCSAVNLCNAAETAGYDSMLESHKKQWANRWNDSDVAIDGDNEAQLALRYSIYHLIAIAPSHTDKMSIPARGLSGQVYKGAIFWDTEIFMLPFFAYTNPDLARNLVSYRCHTLDGARRKAAEYGYRGAFYAWESQDTGDDACTHFNVTDIFTNRPMRTHFRDRQIHITGDVVYGIWQYYKITGDESILFEGGAEVILECARFYNSYSYFKEDKNRYEILNVVGPDEYHERVDNNAFTSMMVKCTLETAIAVLDLLSDKYPDKYEELIGKLDYEKDVINIIKMNELLFIPQPDPLTGVIEQFSGYHGLEDVSLKELKERIIIPNEYLGGTNGLATTTKILKQADVIMLLHLFKEHYSAEIKEANWQYYEPRTEHGSSLSPCAYALVASDIGNIEWAYRYFMKTATVDLNGDTKQYLGTLYIGGTHPAANGGSWLSAIVGFAGLSTDKNAGILLEPILPQKWNSMAFKIICRQQRFEVIINKSEITIKANCNNRIEYTFFIHRRMYKCKPGQELRISY